MQTKQKSIDNFKKYIDDLISSSYVLSDKKLTDLMRSVSTSKLFYTLFEYCTEDFDYEASFSHAFVKGEGYGNGKFLLPHDAKEQIALIFSVLFQINAKEIDFIKLLEQYFFVKNYNESYRNFAMKVLLPFRNEVLRAVGAMAEDDYVPVNTIAKPIGVKTVNEEDLKSIIKLLDDSYFTLLQYKIEPNQKADIVDLYNNFKNSLYDGDGEKIRIAYLGYKYVILFHKKPDAIFKRIEMLLKKNNIIS